MGQRSLTIERDRLRIIRTSAGHYTVNARKRTRFYFAGEINRIKKMCWEIHGPSLAAGRYGMRTLRASISEFEGNMSR